jgi:hypothetical protein
MMPNHSIILPIYLSKTDFCMKTLLPFALLFILGAYSCKSDSNSATQNVTPTTTLNSGVAQNPDVVGQAAKVDPQTGDIDVSSSTTTIKLRESPYQENGCNLISNDLFKGVFGVAVEGNVNINSVPNKGHCIWIWMKPNWKEIENANEKKGAQYVEFKNKMVSRVINFGLVDAAKQQYQVLLKEKNFSYTTKIEGIGEESVWSASENTLAVRKDHLIYYLTIETSTPPENLEKAKTILKAVIK